MYETKFEINKIMASNMREEILSIASDLREGSMTATEAREQLLRLFNVSKRFYWLKPDGSISNMWNEEDHKTYLTDKDIEDAKKDGWQCIQINVC
jgi:hypothetical protein